MKTLDELLKIEQNSIRLSDVKKLRANIVPFVGAGISMSCGLYSWKGLLDELAKQYLKPEEREKYKENNVDLIKYAEEIVQCTSDKRLSKKVAELCKYKKEKLSSLPSIIVKGFSKQIITTNYDTILEDSIKSQRSKWDIILPRSSKITSAYQNKDKFIFKVHGCVKDPSSIVITEQKYRELYTIDGDKHSETFEQLCAIYSGSTLLFLGCSLQNDYTLNALTESVNRIESINHYAIIELPDNDNDKVDLNRKFDEMGILPIYYPKGEYEAIEVLLNYIVGNDRKKEGTNSKNRIKDTAVKHNNIIAENEEESFWQSQEKYIDETVTLIKNDEKLLLEAKKMISNLIDINDDRNVLNEASYDGIKQYLQSGNDRYALSVSGMQGTGKSTFFSLLYYEMLKEKEDTKVCPIIVDLQYWEKCQEDNFRELFDAELKLIKAEINKKEFDKYIFLIDGSDESIKKTTELENVLAKFIEELKGGHFAFCLSYADKIPKSLKKTHSKMEEYSKKSSVSVKLDGLKKGTTELSKLIFSLCKIYGVTKKDDEKAGTYVGLKSSKKVGKKADVRDTIKAIIERDTINKVDYRTILMFIKVYKQTRDDVKTLSIGRCFYAYYLDCLGSKDNMIEAAKLIYDYEILKERDRVDSYKHSEILYKNSITRDFFLAIYFIEVLTKEEYRDNRRKEMVSKRIIFTAQVNDFIKNLMENEYQSDVKKLINNLTHIWDVSSIYMQSQLAYILGRMIKSDSIDKKDKEAKEFLLEKWTEIRNQLFENGTKLTTKKVERFKPTLFLYRTISVSLMKYEETNEQKEFFLKSILENERLSDINRGFHLAYYEDKAYINGSLPLHEDPLDSDIEKTMNHLYENIKRTIVNDASNYRLLSLDIITLFSLYQYRINKTTQTDYASKLSGLIPELLENHMVRKNSIVCDYLTMMQYHFTKHKGNTYATIIQELYNVKNVKRSGWVNRYICEPESIADHMYSTYLLGLFFLPENIANCKDYKFEDYEKYKDYSKNDILDIILIHDLAETITGDIPAPQKTNADEEYEMKIAKIIMYYETFPRIYGIGSKKKLLDSFKNGTSINAILAKELDKIDSLIQAIMYKMQDENKNKINIDEWRNYVKSHVKSSLGIEILDLILSSFEEVL